MFSAIRTRIERQAEIHAADRRVVSVDASRVEPDQTSMVHVCV
jgi:hypothetical protein